MEPMTQEENNPGVRVKIFDQAYNVRGTDPAYILRLAGYVDSKMRTLAGENPTVDSVCLGVLAALRIAHECHVLKTKLEGEESRKPSAKPFTEEDRQRTRKRRERHHSKRWYQKQLLAIANGGLNLTREQHRALIAFGRTRGWNRHPASKR